MKMKKEELYSQINTLKAYKKGMPDARCATDLIKASGYVNIIDMLLLPLYYSWNRLGFGTLCDAGFEFYLNRAYCRFRDSIAVYTLQLLLLLKKVSSIKRLSNCCLALVKSLIGLYSEILSMFKV